MAVNNQYPPPPATRRASYATPQKRMQAAAALFAEVLERCDDAGMGCIWECSSSITNDTKQHKREIAEYRRRWREITGIEVPE